MADSEQDSPPKTVRYDYLKSPDYRTVLCEGIVGGPTPRNMLFLAFWHERPAIPQQVVHEVIATNEAAGGTTAVRIGKELLDQRVSRRAVIRETEFGVILNLETAEALYGWLERNIQLMKDVTKVADKAVHEETK